MLTLTLASGSGSAATETKQLPTASIGQKAAGAKAAQGSTRSSARSTPASGKSPKRTVAAPTAAPSMPLLRLAVEGTYAPFSSIGKGGKLTGFDVDIAQALCAELKARCVLVRRDWPLLQDAVLGTQPKLWDEVDAIVASVSINEGRRATADFTRRYYHLPARFVAKKGTVVEADASKLASYRIGVQADTVFDRFLTAQLGSEAPIVRFPTLPDATAALAAGKVDLVIDNALALESNFLKTKNGARFGFVGPSFTDPAWFGEGAGIALRKGSAELTARLDEALQKLRANGTYEKIASRYFTFDIDPD